jgi:hypothetical protein
MTPTWRSIGNGAKITLGVWALLFVYCAVMAVYQDHEGLVNANKKLTNENVQLTEKIKAFGVPTEESKEKAHRKDVRLQLGVFLTEGNTLQQTVCSKNLADCTAARRRWEAKIQIYLQHNLDPIYAQRFSAHMTTLGVTMDEIQGDMNILNGFINELN